MSVVQRPVTNVTKEQPNWLSFVVDEISLVDIPAVPDAQITAVKRGGTMSTSQMLEAVKALHAQGLFAEARKQGNIDAIISTWDEWAGSWTRCVEQLTGKPGITNPEALCAWLHHEATGKWPAED
jgi:hypothetical protein